MTLKLIHIGLGGWGMDWQTTALRTIKDEVETVAIVEAVEPIRSAARLALGLPTSSCFATLDDAIATTAADAVLITAPVEAHVPLATTAMRAGLHVLSEKPLAASVEQALEGIQVANETGKIYMISQNYRQYPAPRRAAELIREQTYGELGSMSIDFRRWDNDAEPGTNRHYAFVHPLLFDMAIHHWDLMRMVIGAEPSSVFVRRSDPSWSNFVEEAAATAIVTFDNGVVVSYRGTWVSRDEPTHWAGDWRMETSDGLIRWTSRAGAEAGTNGDAVSFRDKKGATSDVPLNPMPVWGRSAQVMALIDAMRTGVEPETSARRNLPSLALMVAAARSMESGQVEPVELPDQL